jgi:hypothetical protein
VISFVDLKIEKLKFLNVHFCQLTTLELKILFSKKQANFITKKVKIKGEKIHETTKKFACKHKLFFPNDKKTLHSFFVYYPNSTFITPQFMYASFSKPNFSQQKEIKCSPFPSQIFSTKTQPKVIFVYCTKFKQTWPIIPRKFVVVLFLWIIFIEIIPRKSLIGRQNPSA